MSKRKMLRSLLTKTTLNLNGEKIVHDSFSGKPGGVDPIFNVDFLH